MVNTKLSEIIDHFAGLRVLVIGEAMLDVYLRGSSERLSPEAPVPVVALGERQVAPGGAANTAVNVANMGASVTFLSVAGHDTEGHTLRRLFKTHGIEGRYLTLERGRRTLSKSRVLAGHQMLVRFDQGTEEPLGGQSEAALLSRLRALYPRSDAVIVSDYGYGILTPRVVEALQTLQARYHAC